MDLITIVSTVLKYGLFALAIVAVLAAFYAIAFLIYRKVLHGTKSLSKRQWIILVLISGWFVLVLGLTTLSRGANYTGSVNFSLFSGYKNAWNQWSLKELQLILFNMLMFSPLGFLLPLLTERGKKFSVACLVSFLVTLFIEVLQLVTGRGIFELDDLLHNFVGSIFGYFVIMFILNCMQHRKIRIKPLFCMLAIPIVFGIIISSAVIVYDHQEYGNMNFIPAEKQNMSEVTIENQAALSDETEKVSVYKNIFADDFEHAKQMSQSFSEFSGVEFDGAVRTDGDNKIFTSASNVQFTCFMRNGWWSYTSWKEYAELSEEQMQRHKEEIEKWLDENNLLPQNAEFSFQDSTMLRWDLEDGDLKQGNSDFSVGTIMVQYDENDEIANFDYLVSANTVTGQEEIISMKEAYEQVLDGNFEQYNPFEKGDTLYIMDCKLNYVYDTKGYYRPVYQFTGYINEKENVWECNISALKK